jgi:hypothetical protein
VNDWSGSMGVLYTGWTLKHTWPHTGRSDPSIGMLNTNQDGGLII